MHLLLTSALKPCNGLIKESNYTKRYEDTRRSLKSIQNLRFSSATFIDASDTKINLRELDEMYPLIDFYAFSQEELGYNCETLIHQGIGFGEYKLLRYYIDNIFAGSSSDRILKIGARTIPVNLDKLCGLLSKSSNLSYFELNSIKKYLYTRIFALQKIDLEQIIDSIDESKISNQNTFHLENHFYNKHARKYKTKRCGRFYLAEYHNSINDGTRGRPLKSNIFRLTKELIRKTLFN